METTRLVNMSKKKKKKEESITIDMQDIISECASGLMTAMSFAVEHRDVEAMLAVSDRWFRLYAEMNGDFKESAPMKIGFIKDNDDQQP